MIKKIKKKRNVVLINTFFFNTNGIILIKLRHHHLFFFIIRFVSKVCSLILKVRYIISFHQFNVIMITESSNESINSLDLEL